MGTQVKKVAVAAAHPLAVDTGIAVVDAGGSAVDAAIAAQAVVAVVMPQAAGLGGDLLALVREPQGNVVAVNGTGRSPRESPPAWLSDGGSSVTVPGLPAAWLALHSRWGKLSLNRVLAPAICLAAEGFVPDPSLREAARAQRRRIEQYGGGEWSLFAALDAGESQKWRQPELAQLLECIAARGPAEMYAGTSAAYIAGAIRGGGGTLGEQDLRSHSTEVLTSVSTPWDGGRLHVQPPASQGVLLAMAAQWLEREGPPRPELLDHLLVEATEAAFEHRDDVLHRGAELLDEVLSVDSDAAGRRGGPRGYLHTAGVVAADSNGLVVSSLISVFDDFGSGVLVPELGIVLNNRAAGFTQGKNAARPGSRPVHTLAPALIERSDGTAWGFSTPGADGQVQTLLQVLARVRYWGESLHDAIGAPRWRSESGRLLIERGHPGIDALAKLGHVVVERPAGDEIFGAVAAAGMRGPSLFAFGDHRRSVAAGVTA